MAERKQIAVYLMTNKHNTVLYLGVTSNLDRRISEHKLRRNPDCFTYKYNVCKVIWIEPHTSIKQAIRREKQIKKWGRAKKVVLIEKQNPKWNDLMAAMETGWGDKSTSS